MVKGEKENAQKLSMVGKINSEKGQKFSS